ncbi:BF3164 family lipoprotein [Roseivirga sp.]|uniref:BF3164 family lipoprotein n=1 Tax=Roseivirga sp. TaxID=1964215 RepID=UPI003B51AAB4
MKNTLPFLLLCSVLACSSPQKHSKPDSPLQSQPTMLSSEVLNINLDSVSRVFNMTLVDSLLILSSPSKDYVFQIIDIKNTRYIAPFGKKGNGPGEIRFPAYVQVDPQNQDNLLIFDKNRFDIYSLPRQHILSNSHKPEKIINKMDFNVQRAVKTHTNSYLAYGIFKNRYALLNSEGDTIKTYLDYPYEDEYNDMSYASLAMAFQGNILASPSGKKVVLATVQSANFEIIDINNPMEPVLKSRLNSWKPEFVNESGGNSISVAFKQESRLGYTDIAVTNQAVYLLLSGRTRSEYGANASESNDLHVYDWSGEPLAHYKLDRDISAFEISASGKELYGFVNEEPALIVKYIIP